ncbi:hypothetical protein IWW38_003751, partial [Coemansia aciculifera]
IFLLPGSIKTAPTVVAKNFPCVDALTASKLKETSGKFVIINPGRRDLFRMHEDSVANMPK